MFLLILRARRKIVLGVLGGFFLFVLILSLLWPNSYTATTSLVVDMKMNEGGVVGMMMPSQVAPGYLATQIDVIKSERVAQRVVALTRLDQIPVMEKQWREETDGKGSIRSWLATLLLKRLDVKPSKESSVIDVSYSGAEPVFSAAVANAFAQAYIETNIALKVESARQYAHFFDEQTKDYLGKLETAQRKFSEYQLQSGLIAGDNRIDIENQRLAELNSQLSLAEAGLATSVSRNSNVDDLSTLVEVINNPVIANLKSQLASREAELSQLLGRYGSNHPSVIELKQQISSLKQQVKEETERVAGSRGTTSELSGKLVDELKIAIEKQKKRILELKDSYDKLAVLQRDVENAQKAYDFVKQGLEQKHIESQTQQTNISVLTPAEPPLKRSSPRVFLNLFIAVILGGLFGIGTAMLLELVDPRVRCSDDLVQFTGVPILGFIPVMKTRSATPRLRFSA
jgi:chain length determinant protein EpsF